MLQQITMEDLHNHLQVLGKTEVVLDVRSPEEFAEAHVPGSLNIPYDQVDQHLETLNQYEKIYIHCRSGKRAQIATQVLLSLGLRNLVCIGSSGMQDWLNAGYPVEQG